MAQKKIHNAKGTGSTTDAVTWVTIATYTLSTNGVSFGIVARIIGKDASGNPAFITGRDAGSRMSGTITMISGLAGLVGLDNISSALATATARINISGDDIQLQVRGVVATDIEWQGYFDIDLN